MTASEPLGARLRGALDACPFLRAVAEEQGAFCAARVACCARGAGPVLQEQDDDCLAATWRLFHSAGGVVPLRTPGSPACQPDAASAPSVCPVTGRRAACPRQDAGEPTSVGDCAVAPHPRSTLPALQAAQAPLASISIPLLGLLPGPGEFWAKRARARRQRRRERQPPAGEPPGPAASSTAQGKAGGPRPRPLKASAQRPAGPGAGRCPLRNLPIIGGLIPLSAKGELACPQAIISARAAAARLKPVRDLRPQALPVKMLAIGVTGALANLPCGAWRVHTRKFSPGWFLAVHATIPFIAILRKAVVMPRWAIALTVAAAVAGQFAGARLERRRLACVARERGAGGGAGCRRAAGAGALLAPLPLAAGLLRQGAGLVMAV